MKNFAGTLLAAAVVAGLAAYAYFGEYKGGIEKDAQKENDARVLRLDKDKLSYLELVRKSGRVVIEKVGDEWRMTAPVKDSADKQGVKMFIASLTGERSPETVIDGETINWATFGLDQPVTQLIAKTSDGKTQVIKIGSIKSFDGQLYAQRDDDKAVLLVNTSWDALLSKPTIDFRDKRLVRAAEAQDLDRFLIEARGRGPSRELELKSVDGKWEFVKGGDSAFPVDGTKVMDYLDRVRGLQAQEFLVEGKQPSDLKKNGIVEPPALKITLSKAAKPVTVLSFGPVLTKEELRVAVSSNVDAITRLSSPTVAQVDTDVSSFIDMGFPFKVISNDVHGFSLNATGVAFEAKKVGDKWALVNPIEGKELDIDRLQNIIKRVGSMQASKVLGNTVAKGVRDGKNEIRLLNDKGEPLMKINWGDLFTDGTAKADTTGKGDDAAPANTQYYIKTSRVERTLAVASVDIDSLGLSELLKAKPVASPIDTKTTK